MANTEPFIGVISDTHGVYDPLVESVFAGAELIVHAGDIGTGVLDRLGRLAPVVAVLGNNDDAQALPGLGEVAEAEALGLRLLVGHIRGHLLAGRDPAVEGFALVVSGHSHRFSQERVADVLYLNPGSAGRPRFGLPRTVALVSAVHGRAVAQVVPL